MGRNKAYDKEWKLKNPEKVKAYQHRYIIKPATKIRRRKWQKEHRQKNAEKYYWYKMKFRYGITKAQWWELHTEQNGVCKICKNPQINGRPLVVDHSHKSKRVRGLLCDNCNLTIGKYEECPDNLLAIASYIVENNWIIDKVKDTRNPSLVKDAVSTEQVMDSCKTN